MSGSDTATANEQLMIELVNRARLDPQGEAARLNITDAGVIAGMGLPEGPLAPVAGNDRLALSSALHSQWMLANDIFSHTGAQGSTAGQRMADAGYVFHGSWSWGENLAYQSSTGTINGTAAITTLHRGLFLSDGHRANILSESFRELGIGQEFGQFMGRNTTMITQNYATSGNTVYLTGVAYDDLDGNDFYSVGEGRAGATFSTALGSSQTTATGAYKVAIGTGTQQVTLAAALAPGAVVMLDQIGSNVKLDLVNGTMLLSSANLRLVEGIADARLLGVGDLHLSGHAGDNLLLGNGGNNVIDGGGGNDIIDGGAGINTAVLSAGPSDLAITTSGDTVTITAPDGTSQYRNISYFRLNGEDLTLDQLSARVAAATPQTPESPAEPAAEPTVEPPAPPPETFLISMPENWATQSLRGDDTGGILRGNGAEVLIMGGTGDDLIAGGAGADTIFGNRGENAIFGGRGDDLIEGGAGNDVISGGHGDDTIHGGGGDNLILGGAGNDLIYGGSGNDRLFGGTGDDTIVAGNGADLIWGGAGADVFVFASGDGGGFATVMDFTPGEDLLQFQGVDLAAGTFADLLAMQAHVHDDMSGLLLSAGDRSVFLVGIELGALGEDDFIFA